MWKVHTLFAAADRSPVACYDMSGNAAEWVHDWSSCDYDAGNQTNPTGPASDEYGYRMTRGYNYDTSSAPGKWCRTAARLEHSAELGTQMIGFRIARTGN